MTKQIKTMKLADLRKFAKKAGVKDWDVLETRQELIDAINAKPNKPVKPVVGGVSHEDTPETPPEAEDTHEEEESITTDGITEERVPVGSKAEIMRKKLARQSKVTILIPLEQGEKKGSSFSVILNGYRLNIRKGAYVRVPRQIADVVMESYDQTIAADEELFRKDGNPMKIDGSESALE